MAGTCRLFQEWQPRGCIDRRGGSSLCTIQGLQAAREYQSIISIYNCQQCRTSKCTSLMPKRVDWCVPLGICRGLITQTPLPIPQRKPSLPSSRQSRYGPFWICSTLVFVTAALGNFASYLSTNAASWHYDVNKVSWAAFTFYGYVAVIPLGLYILLKNLGVVSGPVQFWCLCGYSLLPSFQPRFFALSQSM